MAQIQFGDKILNTTGDVPAAGTAAPSFKLISADLEPVSLSDFAGQRLVLNIFPSIDTPTCAESVRQFNERAAALDNTTVLCVSADLPFAAKRFCGAEGIENVSCASTFHAPSFAGDYGVHIADSFLAGLCARAVVVIDESGNVAHSELVSPISNEPNYDAALAAL